MNPLTDVEQLFVSSFELVQKQVFATNTFKGFHDIDDHINVLNRKYGVPEDLVNALKEARTSQRIALIHSEMSEALESVRKNKVMDDHIPEFSGFEAEMADAVIRIMNLATMEKARLAQALLAKAKYNESRPFKHGGKKF